jgi:hypothetical protein
MPFEVSPVTSFVLGSGDDDWMVAVIRVLGFELAGGSSGLIVELGPLLIAGVAAFAAWLAARTASGRQELLLQHDSERQDRQLAHDRELQNQQHARIVVGQAFERVSHALDRVTALGFSVRAAEQARRMLKTSEEVGDPGEAIGKARRLEEERSDEAEEGIKVVEALMLEMLADTTRLRLIFEPGGTMVRDHYEIRMAFVLWHESLVHGAMVNRIKSEIDGENTARMRFAEGLEAFARTCRKQFGLST